MDRWTSLQTSHVKGPAEGRKVFAEWICLATSPLELSGGTDPIDRLGREGGRTLILSPSLYFSSPSASLLSMRLRSMSLPQPKDFQERGPTLFLLISNVPSSSFCETAVSAFPNYARSVISAGKFNLKALQPCDRSGKPPPPPLVRIKPILHPLH